MFRYLFALSFLFINVCYAQETVVVERPAVVVEKPAVVVEKPVGTVVERPVIVTTVPAPKEVIVTPTGYVNCFTVKAGWYNEVWAAEHRVCQYANSPSGTVWIEGYWACNQYNVTDGQCTNWLWKAAHWEKTIVVY